MLNAASISTEACSATFVNALRDYVGPGKPWSYDSAATALDIERRTLVSYTAGENMPPLTKLLRMACLFGPGFANRLLLVAGLYGAFRQDEQAPVSDLDLNGDACVLIGALGQALRDGRVDHRERPEVVQDARDLYLLLQDWLQQHDGAVPGCPAPATVRSPINFTAARKKADGVA